MIVSMKIFSIGLLISGLVVGFGGGLKIFKMLAGAAYENNLLVIYMILYTFGVALPGLFYFGNLIDQAAKRRRWQQLKKECNITPGVSF